ncbi:MAG: S1/P1 nuclease [bacterium]
MGGRRRVLLALFGAGGFVSLCLTTSGALAFGGTGHEAVCEIAYKELTPTARKAVNKLIRSETPLKDADGKEIPRTFHGACTWPDEKGDVQSSRRAEHFINMPRDWTSFPEAKCVNAATCLFTAIPADIAILKDPNASTDKKRTALKFLGHWLGDIHQPLHISYADDRGGNSVGVKGVSGCAYDGKTALHTVWDTCIPEQVMRDLHIAQTKPAGPGREAFGNVLQKEITDEQRATWKASLDPMVWANESLTVSRAPDTGYCTLSGTTCRYSEDSETYTGGAVRVFAPDGNYKEDRAAIVEERLQAAGVRLGAILNGIFDEAN